jgi:hypothetical protein
MRAAILLLPAALAACSLPGLEASRANDGIHLSWRAFGDGPYVVERRREGADWGRVGRASEPAFVDTSARRGTTYAYRVRAAGGELSGEATVTSKTAAYTEDGLDAPGAGPVAVRRDVHALSAAERARVVAAMLEYITDDVVRAHEAIDHGSSHFFHLHREFLAGMEAHLASRGLSLPRWDPATTIPREFNVVKGRRPALESLSPNLPVPANLRADAIGRFRTEDALRDALVPWHNRVHVRIGGAMGRLDMAPAAPIFWCWHATIDDLYAAWQRARR